MLVKLDIDNTDLAKAGVFVFQVKLLGGELCFLMLHHLLKFEPLYRPLSICMSLDREPCTKINKYIYTLLNFSRPLGEQGRSTQVGQVPDLTLIFYPKGDNYVLQNEF